MAGGWVASARQDAVASGLLRSGPLQNVLNTKLRSICTILNSEQGLSLDDEFKAMEHCTVAATTLVASMQDPLDIDVFASSWSAALGVLMESSYRIHKSVSQQWMAAMQELKSLVAQRVQAYFKVVVQTKLDSVAKPIKELILKAVPAPPAGPHKLQFFLPGNITSEVCTDIKTKLVAGLAMLDDECAIDREVVDIGGLSVLRYLPDIAELWIAKNSVVTKEGYDWSEYHHTLKFIAKVIKIADQVVEKVSHAAVAAAMLGERATAVQQLQQVVASVATKLQGAAKAAVDAACHPDVLSILAKVEEDEVDGPSLLQACTSPPTKQFKRMVSVLDTRKDEFEELLSKARSCLQDVGFYKDEQAQHTEVLTRTEDECYHRVQVFIAIQAAYGPTTKRTRSQLVEGARIAINELPTTRVLPPKLGILLAKLATA